MTDGGPDAVEAWLRRHPRFLAERPALYTVLTPPKRPHGEAIADHMAAMISAERAKMAALELEFERMLAQGRAQDGFADRIARAVLALMRTRDAIDTVSNELPALLGIDSCTLAAEAPARRGVLPLPPGTVARLIGTGRDALVRAEPADAALLHAEQALLIARDALARVPGPTPMLIALGARDAAALPENHAAPQLAFLGRAVAAALAR
ncbi:MAG: DUF484 family protein [Pseudomonadota bacterium]